MKIIPKKQQGGNIWDKNIVSNIKRKSYEDFLKNLSDDQKKEIATYYANDADWKKLMTNFETNAKNLSDKLGIQYKPPMSAMNITAPVKDDEDEIVEKNPAQPSSWEKQMNDLGYTKMKTPTGDSAYRGHDGTIYFNNGRMQKNNQMLNYDYMQLGQNTNPIVNTQAAVKTKSVTKTQPVSTRSKFNTTKFLQSKLGQGEKYQFGNTEYVRYDPVGQGDFYIDPNTGAIYESKLFGTLGNKVQYNPNWQNDNPYAIAYRTLKQQLNGFYKHNGGKMNKIKYFQQGGAAPQQQDLQQQVIALVQAAMQGDQQATQQVNQIMEAAKSGDPQATQIAQMIQQVVQQMQGQATSAKWGAKLRYIQSLKYAKGGKTCPECEKQKIEEKKCGGKAKKKYFGGIL